MSYTKHWTKIHLNMSITSVILYSVYIYPYTKTENNIKTLKVCLKNN